MHNMVIANAKLSMQKQMQLHVYIPGNSGPSCLWLKQKAALAFAFLLQNNEIYFRFPALNTCRVETGGFAKLPI